MSRPLSLNLCERVVASVLAGESCRSAVERFGVAVSSVVKWLQRQRAAGSVAPGKMGGTASLCLIRAAPLSPRKKTHTPHLTWHGVKAELVARGIKVSHNAVWLLDQDPHRTFAGYCIFLKEKIVFEGIKLL